MVRKVLLSIIAVVFILLSASFIFIFGSNKGYEVRKLAATTILSTQHRHWAKYTFLPQNELNTLLEQINNPKYKNSHLPSTSVQTKQKEELTISVKTIEKKYSTTNYYKGKIMTISNPFNIELVGSSLDNQGEQIFVLSDRVNAIGAINASGFVDPNGRGNGGVATGIVIENKNVKYDSSGNKEYVAGLTEKGHLVTGYYTASELTNLGVKHAAGFKPQLIVNGEKMIEGDGGWGIGPRSAIGQKKDGSIVFIVVDGRQLHSVGATLKEVQDILYKNGVVNAMSMDGGSSASMYFNGENITTPSSVGNIPRYLPNIWAVVPKENQKVKIYNEGELIEEYTNENK